MPNVMVFPCGSQVGLEIRNSLTRQKNIKLIGCSSQPDKSACLFDDFLVGGKNVFERGFVKSIADIVKKNSIDVIYAANDDAQLVLSKSRLRGKTIGSNHKTNEMLRSKSMTYSVLGNHLQVPRSLKDNPKFPLFFKPDKGSGSKDCHLVRSDAELKVLSERFPEHVACEYLPGEEFTVDCFTDRNGKLLVSFGRSRIETRSGMAVETSESEERPLQDMAATINGKLEFRGPWFFQTKKDASGNHVLLEVNTRIASCSSLTRMRGVNLSLLALFDHMGEDCSIYKNKRESQTQSKFLYNVWVLESGYKRLYVDFDDCLCVDGKVNADLIKFVFECRNRGMRVNVLSKHSGDLKGEMMKLGILGIFDEIMHIGKEERKSQIVDGDSILVDDSFNERIGSNCKCLVLSPDVFEFGSIVFV